MYIEHIMSVGESNLAQERNEWTRFLLSCKIQKKKSAILLGKKGQPFHLIQPNKKHFLEITR